MRFEPTMEPRGRLWAGILVAWCAASLGLFAWSSRFLTGPAADSLLTLLLGIASTYAFWFTGWRLWRRWPGWLPPASDALERTVLELALGLCIAIGLMILAGALRLYHSWFAYGLLAVGLAGGHRPFWGEIRARLAARSTGPREPWRLLAPIVACAAVMTCLESLAPVAAQDALVYHLAVPAKYIERGGFERVEGNFFAQFPQNVEMLFTLGLLLKNDSLAQWFHWLMGAAASAAVAALARALDVRASGLLAAAAFATIPTVMLISGWAYVDLGVVLFTTLSTLCFVRWWSSENRRWLLASAVLAGAAAGCKYTAGFQGLLITSGVVVLGVSRRWGFRRVLADSTTAALVVGSVVCPWWIKNIVQTGNPLYPFCHGLLGGEGWDSERAQVLAAALAQWGGERGLLETLALPWRLTLSGRFFSEAHFDGMIGCVFLAAAPLVLLGLKVSREHRLVAVLALAHGLFWATMTRQVRFLLPALATAAALLGAVAPVLPAAPRARAAARALLQAAVAYNVLIASLHFASHNPLPVVLGLESRGQFLERELPGRDYAVFEFIEKELPRDSYILFGSLGNVGFLARRNYHSDALFENRTLSRILAGSPGPDEAFQELRSRGFTHFLFRMENVFDPTGERSEIPIADQKKLMRLLNEHGRLLAQANGTMLYELFAADRDEKG